MATALTLACYGRLNVLTLVMGASLIGIAIDFGVDLIARYEEELQKGVAREAALTLARILGVAPEEMACIGDMPNDIAMLKVAGLAIAIAVQVIVNWISTILGVPLLTSLYGFFVEGRDF